MIVSKKKGKVPPNIKAEIVKMVACGFNPSIIQQALRDEYDFDLTKQCIWKSYICNPKFRVLAEKFQETITQELQKIPIARKEVRLLVIQKAINECLRERVSKREYDEDGNVTETMVKLQPAAVASLVKEARAETEGEIKDEEKITMLDIIRNFTKKSVMTVQGEAIGNCEDGGKLGPGEPPEPNKLDSQNTGVLEVL